MKCWTEKKTNKKTNTFATAIKWLSWPLFIGYRQQIGHRERRTCSKGLQAIRTGNQTCDQCRRTVASTYGPLVLTTVSPSSPRQKYIDIVLVVNNGKYSVWMWIVSLIVNKRSELLPSPLPSLPLSFDWTPNTWIGGLQFFLSIVNSMNKKDLTRNLFSSWPCWRMTWG